MDNTTIEKLGKLSQLHLDDAEREALAHDLNTIIQLIDTMREVDTNGVEPLAHPLDLTQTLREDEPRTDIDRGKYQSLSTDTRDGLYVVPLVIQQK